MLRRSRAEPRRAAGAAAGQPGQQTGVVRLTGVGRSYRRGDNRIVALADVTIDFQPGTFTAIMGPSGSGKSTLLQCAAGLDRVDHGQVVIDGHDVRGWSEAALTVLRRDRIGFVFQSFNLVPSLTAWQNVELPLRLARRQVDGAEVDRVLADVGLADRAGHRPSELSGGQQQRVAIARALVARPRVVFADEPTGALDSRSSREVLGLLRGLVDDHGQTVVMVTHDPLSASYSGRVVFLADGRVVDELPTPTTDVIAARMASLEAAPC